MNPKLRIALAVAVLVALVGVGAAVAAATGPQITWDVVAGGGGVSTGTGGITLMDTIGQPVVDVSSGTGVQSGAGFWYLLAVKYNFYLPAVIR